VHEERPGVHLGYQPALDGLRGIAVLSVLLYHGEVPWFDGGFLGVSTFFTLSGFLITTLLLAEDRQNGRVDLGAFYIRRVRRLLPAALLCLAGIVVFGATVATASQVVALRGDVLAALAYVANWRQVFSGSSYADLFTAPSPVQHFWSLAIEEQFYLVMPLLVLGVLKVAGGSWRVLRNVLVGLVVASIGLSVLLYAVGSSLDRIYFGTDTRAAELLIGAVLAVAVSLRGSITFDGVVGRRVQVVGTIALLVTLVLWATTSLADTWLYAGGFGFYGLVTAAVVLAAVQPTGIVRTVLAWRPLVLVGLISYGAYLYHWPIYLWLDEARTGLDGVGLLAVRLAVTAGAAIASYALVEKPIRAGITLHGGVTPWVALPMAVCLVAVAAVAVTVDPPDDQVVSASELDASLVEDAVDPVEAVDPGNLGEVTAGPELRIAFYGDSSALTLAVGANEWIDATPGVAKAGGIAQLGCGIGRGGRRISEEEAEARSPDDCWSAEWAANTQLGQPDLAVVLSGLWDLTDRQIPGDDRYRAPGDPVYDEFLLEEMEAATQVLIDGGAEVVWLTTPKVEFGQQDGVPPEDEHPASEAGRAEALNRVVREVAARHPGDVHVLDLQAYLQSLPGGEMDPSVRPDGVHFTTPSARTVTEAWLGPALLDLWQQDQAAEGVVPGSPPPPTTTSTVPA
jgi:peptidoglycan/LPS O-acetylase OafA/YrhL